LELDKKNEGQEEEGVTTNQDLGDGRNENTNPVILRKSTRAGGKLDVSSRINLNFVNKYLLFVRINYIFSITMKERH
jgi:hypothetical protein